MTSAEPPNAAGNVAPPPTPADVGIVAALSIEVAPLVAALAAVRKYKGPRLSVVEGELAGKLVALAVTGPGRKAAEEGTRLLLDGHRPRWVVSAGFAGALDPSLRRGDVVVAEEVLDPEGHRYTIGMHLDPPDPSAAGPRVLPGRLLTVDRIVRTADEKRVIAREHGAQVVDMETSAVAALCAGRGVRFLSVRVVSDDANADLPPEVLTILGRSGGYRVGAAFGAIVKRPSSVFDLLGLREHAHQAAERLARVLPALLGRLG